MIYIKIRTFKLFEFRLLMYVLYYFTTVAISYIKAQTRNQVVY